ncbi:MAG: DUF1460 domain-containing protein [Bacteroidaceae bacterium]|nr:DUF1460 domain-containing protein [Bacteroidaceae bacterium]
MKTIFCIIINLFCLSVHGQGEVEYTKEDSVKVCALLADGRKMEADKRFMHYALALVGTPYEGGTLERYEGKERLVVNMRTLDCTTYVDVVMALTLASDEGTFGAFCRQLRRVRYRDGRTDGYASRNHYFAENAENLQRQGLATIIDEGDDVQTLAIDYMTTHRNAYRQIATDDIEYARICKAEKALTGKRIRFWTRNALMRSDNGRDKGQLKKHIKTGDIIGIVTRKKGLDTTHIGIAYWGDDGRLHLLNASRLRGKVVVEPRSLHQYMTTQKSQLGVRIVRWNPSSSSGAQSTSGGGACI